MKKNGNKEWKEVIFSPKFSNDLSDDTDNSFNPILHNFGYNDRNTQTNL